MSKEHGLGNALYVAGHDLSGDTQSWGLSGSKPMQDTTTLRMKAFDRLGLIPDGAINYQTLLDNAVGNAHAYLSTLPTTDGLVTICHRELVGSPAGCMFGKQIGYDATRGGDGALTFKVDAQASKGSFVDWGVLLTDGMRVDTAGTNGASWDFGAAHAFGLQAYLHVFAFTGTSATIKLQSSSDNGVGDAWTDLTAGSFGAQSTANVGSMISTARNAAIERYLRVVTTGVFTSVTFAVAVAVNETEVKV